MAKITRTPEAKIDLAEIACYIAERNATAAERWLDSVDKLLRLLAANPLMGEAVDHLKTGLRRYTHGRYLIFFRPEPTGILLYRVLHGARRLEELLS